MSNVRSEHPNAKPKKRGREWGEKKGKKKTPTPLPHQNVEQLTPEFKFKRRESGN
jgi:hypothetical protein